MTLDLWTCGNPAFNLQKSVCAGKTWKDLLLHKKKRRCRGKDGLHDLSTESVFSHVCICAYTRPLTTLSLNQVRLMPQAVWGESGGKQCRKKSTKDRRFRASWKMPCLKKTCDRGRGVRVRVSSGHMLCYVMRLHKYSCQWTFKISLLVFILSFPTSDKRRRVLFSLSSLAQWTDCSSPLSLAETVDSRIRDSSGFKKTQCQGLVELWFIFLPTSIPDDVPQ